MFVNKLLFIMANLLLLVSFSFATENFDLIQYYNRLTHQEKESLLQTHQDIDRSNLEKMIGLPFYEAVDVDPFFVGWRNDQGDAFGIAHFQNALMPKEFEFVFWSYNPEEGFYVILRESDLDNEGLVGRKIHNILINKNGVVASMLQSTHFDPEYPDFPNFKIRYNSLLSWSKEYGLFLDTFKEHALFSDPTTKKYGTYTLYNLNNKGYFLTSPDPKGAEFYIINTKDSSEVLLSYKDLLNQRLYDSPNKGGFEWGFLPSNVQYHLDDDGNIIGEVEGTVNFKKVTSHDCCPCTERYQSEIKINFIMNINGERYFDMTVK